MHAGAPVAVAKDASPRLRAENVSVSFAGLKAVNAVDFHLSIGEVVGLIGPNGSGKTSLLNVLSGVYKASSGDTYVGESRTTAKSANQIAQLGVARTFQNIRLFSHLTVLNNVAVGASFRPEKPRGIAVEKAARETLDILGLSHIASASAGSLPYGVRRRVEIARALASKPSFLLLDEPAAGANAAESEELSGLIEFIAESFRVGILIIEHDLRLMMRVSDRIVALTGGSVIAEGDADTISRDQKVREAYFGKNWATRSAQLSAPTNPTNQGEK